MTKLIKTGRKGYDSNATKALNHFKAARVTARKYGTQAGQVIQERVDISQGIDLEGGETAHDFGDVECTRQIDPAYRVELGLEALAKLDGLAGRLDIAPAAHAETMAALWGEYARVAA